MRGMRDGRTASTTAVDKIVIRITFFAKGLVKFVTLQLVVHIYGKGGFSARYLCVRFAEACLTQVNLHRHTVCI